jgi:hypothetical protein
MLKFYRVRSEAYFRPSEIFVNDGNHSRERSPYPVDWGNLGGRQHGVAEKEFGNCCRRVWKS